ncbi:hypothetical protein [Pseudomonas asiatica]|uniref:Uncharacterized protein n=1 Tax=Pseudomonas asiatica TaxID=2219225 RepID=A0ABU5KVT2_9PSED|nr:hypothetical protein [Pseudomonas asiatica]MDZ5738036.1 hypothetical protein [Pseudomonas asiatica]MDZ5744632.1 hypothetical protein [Pseudomonas asiatica]MDZ5748792.1 hypothetical protein [Pseudomonas asiatica]MDZ5753124.1 hypothetical protein [Pseudomonas asiatica]
MPQKVEKKTNPFKILLGGVLMSTVMLLLSVLLGILAVNHLGLLDSWLKWREGNYLPLLLWRLALYCSIVFAWVKLKARLPEPEPGEPSKAMQRIEFLVLLLFVIIEISKAPIAWSEVL